MPVFFIFLCIFMNIYAGPREFVESWTARAPSELAVFPLHSPHKDFFLNKVARGPHRVFSHKSCLFLAARTHTSHGTNSPLKLLFLNKVPSPVTRIFPISLSAELSGIRLCKVVIWIFSQEKRISISCSL